MTRKNLWVVSALQKQQKMLKAEVKRVNITDAEIKESEKEIQFVYGKGIYATGFTLFENVESHTWYFENVEDAYQFSDMVMKHFFSDAIEVNQEVVI